MNKDQFGGIEVATDEFGGIPVDQEPPKPAGALRKAGDLGISLAKGAVALPEAAVGVADIVSGGRAGRALEEGVDIGGVNLGFRPKEAKAFIDQGYSDDYKAKRQAFQDADGVVDKTIQAVTNPSLITNAVAESAPSMLGGAGVARGVMAAAPRVGAIGAGALGEGVVGAGSAAEQIRQETDDGLLTGKQSALAGASGAAATVLGVAGGAASRRLGIADVDTALARGSLDAVDVTGKAAQKGLLRRTGEGFASEGFLEELPQSLSEQALQNVALDRPIEEGLADAAVMGALTGGVMGGGAAALTQARPSPTPPPSNEDVKPEAGPGSAQPEPGTFTGTPPGGFAPPGSVPTTETAPAAPVTPEAAGVDPAAGPLSAGVAAAVSSGEVAQQQQAQQQAAEDQQAAGETPQFAQNDPEAQAQQQFKSIGEALDFISDQPGAGASLDLLPMKTEGGYTLARQGTPEYADAWKQRFDRLTTAGVREGDVLNRNNEPFTRAQPTILAQALRARGPGFQAVAVDGGFVIRQASAATPAAAAPQAAKADPAPAPAPAAAAAALPGPATDAGNAGQAVAPARDGPTDGQPALTALAPAAEPVQNAVAPDNSKGAGTAPATPAGPATAEQGTGEKPAPGKREAPQNTPAAPGVQAPAPASPDVGIRGGPGQPTIGEGNDGPGIPPAGRDGAAQRRAVGDSGAAGESAAGPVVGEAGPRGVPAAGRGRQPDGGAGLPGVGEGGRGAGPADAGRAAPLPVVEHTTSKGKLLRGVIRTDLDLQSAKAIDTGSFKKDGGWFIRDRAFDKLAEFDAKAEQGDELDAEMRGYEERAGKNGTALAGPAPAPADVPREATPLQQRVAKAKAAKEAPAEPRLMDYDGRTRDRKPLMPGDVFRTSSGRATTPYPAQKGQKFATQWLIDNAVAEARARGDDFNASAFEREKPGRDGVLPPASGDSLNEYLWGEQPAVVPSILKPLVPAAQAPATLPDPELAPDRKPDAAPAPAKPSRRQATDEAVRAGYFQPGAIVKSYSGHDRVVSYKPSVDGEWSVTVQAVQRKGDAWVNVPNEQPRQHSTPPEKRNLEAGPVQAAPTADAPTPAAPAANTIFTQDAYEAARARMKKKLGTLNTGIDPELLTDGIVVAGYHLEKGARKFAAWAQAMLTDMGEEIRPYLKQLYLAAKFDPRASTLDGMDTAALVEGADVEAISPPAAAPAPAAAAPAPALPPGKVQLYSQQKVTPESAAAIADWAREQGFKDVVDDMHVTLAFSRTPVDASAVPLAKSLTVVGGPRTVAPLGDKGAVVLKIGNPTLHGSHELLRQAGASWDFEGFQPHVTITYNGAGVDLAKVTPYRGPIGLMAEERSLLEVDDAPVSAPAAAGPAVTLGDRFDQLLPASMPKDNPALKRIVTEFDGKEPDAARMKTAQEELEAAIVRAARKIVSRAPIRGVRKTFDTLLDLYKSQPLLNVRTSTSIANQAYSTPAPLAYLASQLAGIGPATGATLEPTAGTGMLLIAADQAKAQANEIDPTRVGLLLDNGFDVTRRDASAEGAFKAKSVPRVITNPPFGPIKDAAGESIKVKIDGYTIGQIDHLIAVRALAAMQDDGRATLIIGANKAPGGRSENDRTFMNWLYSRYNVTSHFEVEGDLYQRQGAGWPVRVISIAGRQQSDKIGPSTGTVERASTWEEVYDQFAKSVAAGGPAVGAGRTDAAAADDAQPVPRPAADAAGRADPAGREGGAPRDGAVARGRPGAVGDRGAIPEQPVGQRDSAVGSNDQSAGPVEGPRPASAGRQTKPVRDAGSTGLESGENQFQTVYVPRSSVKDEGVLIPVNMAEPTQTALSKLEDAVGDIDAFAARELGYASVKAMHDGLMGLQVDSVASAIHQIKKGKAIIIADQTGIGKGRQAAAVIRWALKQGRIPVFVSVKPSLFSDMYGDLHDIGTDDVAPFILNSDGYIKNEANERLFKNKPALHKGQIRQVAASGQLPEGSNAVFLTYSQINTANIQREALLALAPNAVFVLDESHNAAGESSTGEYMRELLDLANGVTYLSATYAKRPDNMPLYFKTDMGEAVADDDTLLEAMAAGGLPLQTVVSNNLVAAGQMFRRERSYDGVSIESRADTKSRAAHVKLSDSTTLALRAIVAADRTFHAVFIKSLQKAVAGEGGAVLDIAGNQVTNSVDHTEFSSVVHNFVRQMLLGLQAQNAADEAIASLKRGEKPLIALENTMGSFLSEYAENNGIKPGGDLGSFDYRTVLSRALERSRYVVLSSAAGEKSKHYIALNKLDAVTREAYDNAQKVINSLRIDIPVSPLDWMRNEITKAGYSVAEITGRDLAVDYSSGNAVLAQVPKVEREDKVGTTRRFNGNDPSGATDALILNVAGSTGISLHASERFANQQQRHMIVVQPAQDINIFMQMLGRIHRTGQVRLPKYTLLSTALPAEIRPTALLSAKMKSLNANTSSNTDSATSVKAQDMLNKYGDEVVGQYLLDNPKLADALGIKVGDDGTVEENAARKATGRLALMPVTTQEAFYAEVQEQYQTLIDYLNKTNQNELEPRTFDFDAQETNSQVIFEGENKDSPFGEDAVYGEYSIKAQGKMMTPAEIKAAIATNLEGATPATHVTGLLAKLNEAFAPFLQTQDDKEQQARAQKTQGNGAGFIAGHPIGSTWRVVINDEPYNAVITNVRSTHKTTGNPFSMSKIQVTVAVNGSLRSLTVPATKFLGIENSRINGTYTTLDSLFRAPPPDEREVAKIITGNLLGAYGEMKEAKGTIIAFTKKDGTTAQGILLPKAFNPAKELSQDYRMRSGAEAVAFLHGSTNENIDKYGINNRAQDVRVLPDRDGGVVIKVPKSKAQGAKYFLDRALLAQTGDFESVGNQMVAYVKAGKAAAALDVLMARTSIYTLPSMSAEAKAMAAPAAPPASRLSEDRLSSPALNHIRVDDFIAGVRAGWKNSPEVVVVRNMQDSRLNPVVRAYYARQRADGVVGAPKGSFYDGKVYLFTDQLTSDRDAAETLFHEALGHYGLRGTFGPGLGHVLDVVAASRSADMAKKAAEYGFDLRNASQRRATAEELLAEMAEKNPGLPLVRRAIAAIRTWLRENVPFFGGMQLTDDEIVRNFILPARAFVVNGPAGGPGRARSPAAADAAPASSATPTPFYSERAAAGLPMFSLTKAQIQAKALDAFHAIADTPGKLSWWHKTVGTQYNLAQRSPEYKRVFDSVQAFLGDVSRYATDAADLAPKILPKLETIRDIGKKPISADDNKAIAAPIFEGTLSWMRDPMTRKPVPMADVEARAAEMTPADKGQALLRANLLSPAVLKMWQGLPVDQHDAMVAGKYEREMLRPGIVWTDAELAGQFKLTPAQIGLYREFRASVDHSLKDLAVSDMVRYAGKDAAEIRPMVLDAATADEAAQLLREHLLLLADSQEDQAVANRMRKDADVMLDKAAKVADLSARGYAPLSRFGQYTLDVVDAEGERVYFGMFESRLDAAAMAKKMTAEFPGAAIRQGTVSQQEYKLFAGVSPETLELFGEQVGLEGSELFQQYLKLAKSTRSAMKRLIQRKGTAGFSEEAGRVLAGFVYSNARQTSANLHTGEMREAAASDALKGQGELRDAAIKLVDYVSNPQEEAQALRGLLFAQYIGGSVASAAVNLTQTVAMTFPYLTQYGGVVKAAGQMRRAIADALKPTTGDAVLDRELKLAEARGTVAPQEVHQLIAQAAGKGSLQSGDGTRTGDALATANNAASRFMLGWGKMFSAAEQFNRRTTFIAAYRTAVEQGIPNPAGFADKAIAETQGVYNKGNKPAWARGAVGATLFTFKQYGISYVELVHRMATSGPEGRRAAGIMLGMLFLLAGAGGLPFEEDLEDVIDGIMQRLGYSFSAKASRQQFLIDTLGKPFAEFIDRGLSGIPGVPIDVSGRLGMGNLLPGTGLLTKKTDHSRDVAEVAGVGGDFVKRGLTAVGQLADGDPVKAALTMMPTAARNLAIASDMATTGLYRDQRGRKVLDVDGWDAAAKAIGFQPGDVARVQEATGLQQNLIAQVKIREAEIADAWAIGVFEKDAEKVQAAREALQRWNDNNPAARIVIKPTQIASRVRSMAQSKSERIAKTAPAEIRAAVRRELQETP